MALAAYSLIAAGSLIGAPLARRIEGDRAMTIIMTSGGLDRFGEPRPMEGRVAVVVGSTRGIGLAIAEALAAAGAMIVLNGAANSSEIEKTCQVIGARYDVPVRYELADVSDPRAICDMMERVGRSFGPVEFLVNNARIPHMAVVEDLLSEKWDAILATSLSAVFHATHAVLPEMIRRGFGRIVNIIPTVGTIASPLHSAYAAIRHGVIGLTRAVALEAADRNVTCNAVCAGVTREATFAAVATAVLFLCGDAATAITGAVLPADLPFST